MAITHSVKFAASAKDAISEIQKYEDRIVATASTVDKHAASLGGGKMLAQANNWTAAVGKVGGATGDLATKEQLLAGASKLTATEKQRVNKILDQAIQKYTALGQTAPTAMRDLHEATKKLPPVTESWAQSVGKAAAGYVAGMVTWSAAQRAMGSLVDFVGSSVTAFAESERAQRSLSVAMRLAGVDSENNRAAFEALAAEMQRTSVYEDDQVTKLMSIATTLGVLPTQMGPVIKASANMAAELGMPIEQALKLLVRANNESVSALKEMGITLDETRVKGEGLPYVLDQINSRMGGQYAAEVETYSGALKQLGNTWGDMKEAVGQGTVSLLGGATGLHAIGRGFQAVGLASQTMRELPVMWTLLNNPLKVFEQTWSSAWRTVGEGPKEAAAKAEDGLMRIRKAIDSSKAAGDRYVAGIKAEVEAERQRNLDERRRKQEAWNASITSASERMYWLNGAMMNGVPVIGQTAASALAAARAANELAEGLLESADAYSSMTARALEAKAGTAAVKAAMGDFAVTLPTVKSSLAGTKGELANTGQTAKTAGQMIGAMEKVWGAMADAAERGGHKTTAAIFNIAEATERAFAQGGPWAAAVAFATSTFAAFQDKLFKTEGKKVNDMRDGFVAAAGGLHELNVKAQAAGLTLDRLLKAKTVQEYEAAVAQLNDAFAAQKNKIEEMNRALEEQKRLRAEIEGQIDAVVKETASLRASLIPAWDEVSGLMQKYGLEMDGAGQKIQALKLLHDSTSIINDLEKWQRAGGDTGVMLDGMAKSLIQMANDARKYGVELPAQMQPLLQTLADQGKLVDGNGTKLKDLTGIKFGAPVESEADRINKAIDKLVLSLAELVDKLNKLPGVAENVSKELEQSLGEPPWPRGGWPSPFPGGSPDAGDGLDYPTGGSRAASYPGFAGGTGGRFLDFGAGTPVVLHGRERVMTEQEAAPARGGSLTVPVYISQYDRTPLVTVVFEDLVGLLEQLGR